MKRPLIGTALLTLTAFAAVAEERTFTLAVENMTCALCPITVTKAIEGIDGVVEVTVDYDTRRATVRFDDATMSLESIARASLNAGFPASKTE